LKLDNRSLEPAEQKFLGKVVQKILTKAVQSEKDVEFLIPQIVRALGKPCSTLVNMICGKKDEIPGGYATRTPIRRKYISSRTPNHRKKSKDG
jgi:hypothetical protein